MRAWLKRVVFRLLRKDPEAVVLHFASGDPELVRRMVAEVRELEPNRRHFIVSDETESAWTLYRRFRPYRIGLAPVLFTGRSPLRWKAFLLAPRKILAFNARLERHHLRLSTWIASLLFLRGVPLDRIWLRPRWLFPWRRDRSVYPTRVREFEGRALRGRRRVAVLSPYFPFPLSHGGAVRIFYLLREMAVEFDVVLLAFSEGSDEEVAPVLEYCSRVVLVDKPRYREPRWSTLLPPEVHEYRSPAMRDALARVRRELEIDVVQVEYTALAPYGGDVLVEHDITYDLHAQVSKQKHTFFAWWDYSRWRRFERKWVRRYKRVVVMSERDQKLLGVPAATVIPNGVDLDRFRPEIERRGQRLLFIGSFRHFPNVVAYRFFVEQVWPLLPEEVRATVVAGPDPQLYWTDPPPPRIELLGFVADVRPLYTEANLVIVPTLVSAGTNLKVLEALAMERAVVSTPSGCGGLGLEHGRNVWIAESAAEFAEGIRRLLADGELRGQIARRGSEHAEAYFGWHGIGQKQRAVLRELGAAAVSIRRAVADDVSAIVAIQQLTPEASQWKAEDYLIYDCHVALLGGAIRGFLVSRRLADGEREILNVAVHPDSRRAGIASELIRLERERWPGVHFLEVRESNTAARALYQKLGFEEVGARPDYYDDPPETGIVMRIRS